MLPNVVLSDELLTTITRLCCEFDVDGLRADIVMYKTARVLAALDDRRQVNLADVRAAAELVLPHRRRRRPFEQAGLDREQLDRSLDQPPGESAACECFGRQFAGPRDQPQIQTAMNNGERLAMATHQPPPTRRFDEQQETRLFPDRSATTSAAHRASAGCEEACLESRPAQCDASCRARTLRARDS